MQLELFCAEDTMRTYEQMIASHVQRERQIRLLESPGSENRVQEQVKRQTPLAACIEATRRKINLFSCLVTSRRWSPCSAQS